MPASFPTPRSKSMTVNNKINKILRAGNVNGVFASRHFFTEVPSFANCNLCGDDVSGFFASRRFSAEAPSFAIRGNAEQCTNLAMGNSFLA